MEEIEIIADLEVVMKKTFKEKVDWFSSEYDSEIGGFITGEIKDGKIILEDLLIPEQESGYADVNFSPQDLVKLRKDYGDKCLKIIGEWHSHHNMGLGWSSTDLNFIKEFADPREITCFVLSSMGRHLVRIEMRKPFNISLDNVAYKIELNTELEGELKKIIQTKIKKSSFDRRHIKFTDTTGTGTGQEELEFVKDEEGEWHREDSIESMIKIHKTPKIVEVFDLGYSTSELMKEELKKLNPLIRYEKGSDTMGFLCYKAEFQFRSKKQLKKGVKKIRDFLREFKDENREGSYYDGGRGTTYYD